MQPENQGGSFIEDVRLKRKKRTFERNGVCVLPCLGRQTEFTETVGAPGQVVPKRPPRLSVSPISRSDTNLDVNVEESGHVRAYELDPERVDEFGPTDADEDVAQEAEELKHVVAPILPSKAEVESHNI